MENTESSIPVANVTQPVPLPEWLQEPQLPTPDDPRKRGAAVTQSTYPNLFENALERIMAGQPLAQIVNNDQRGIQLGRFLYWINADPTRRRRYEEACAVAAETLAHSLITVADAEDSMEDVQRTAIRIKTRTYLMEKWSPNRYGDSKRIQIDQTSLSANLSADDLAKLSLADLKKMALEKFAQAAQRSDTIDVIPVEPAERDAA